MTAIGISQPAPGAAVGQRVRPARRRGPGLRLARLYLVSRRVLTCLLVLAAAGIALRIALHWLPRTGVAARQLPLTIEAGAAAAIGVTTRSPFGEPEDTAGPWVRWLRLAVSLALAGAAFGALAAGAAGQHLADGTLGLLRDLGGFTGLALLTAALIGGGLAWIGPLAYVAVTLPALDGPWATPWTWAARPPHDRGAAICAGLVFASGLALLTARGARAPDSALETALRVYPSFRARTDYGYPAVCRAVCRPRPSSFRNSRNCRRRKLSRPE
ncbi:MAG TPA: hypothetical protein VHY31_24095 [Streptosporangiaceae bacterium]|nr:hypothetical protein [Streptosporangiaceae bacterium]